jgi:PhnB protein
MDSTTTVKPIPDGYTTITPFLAIESGKGSDAIEFYKRAFGAVEVYRMGPPDGPVFHATLQFGNARLYLSDMSPPVKHEFDFGKHMSTCLYVVNCDEVYETTIKEGCKVVYPIADKFYGDRAGTVNDPFGHQWTLTTHIKDMTNEEIEIAAKAAHATQ